MATTRDVLGVLGPMAAQIQKLRERQLFPGVPHTTTTTTTTLTTHCQTLSGACDLLCGRLQVTAEVTQDAALLEKAGQVKERLREVTDALKTCSEEMQIREGEGLAVAWGCVVGCLEGVLEEVSQALVVWGGASAREVTRAASHLHTHLTHLKNLTHLSSLRPLFQATTTTTTTLLHHLHHHRHQQCQAGRREALWHYGHLLALSIHLMGLCVEGALAAESLVGARVCVSLACDRVGHVLSDLTSLLDPACPDPPLPDLHPLPVAFTKQIDKVLAVLDSANERDRERESATAEKENAKRERENSATRERENTNERERERENASGDRETATEERERETTTARERESAVGQNVKILLEDILKHSLAVAHCCGGVVVAVVNPRHIYCPSLTRF
ncbi:uncharacterized protein LOC123509121 [Portunus trituberculatus]|uniref:uncharacterized protein LOC123509121 n=1 Tax=Portunus trituberculatus TaxID=210409 RepID=UPI001E1D1AD1|nr:uncharacterized protein LOC123509121 [Portunus trituberculatus]